MDISTFRAELAMDGARPNRFLVYVQLPFSENAQLQTASARNFGQYFSFMCKTAAIPESQVGRVVVPYQGREIYLAGDRTFADWTVTVMNDEDFRIRKVLEMWMAKLNYHKTNVRDSSFESATSYTADCIVEHLRKTGESIPQATYKMTAAFPTNISDIQLDWGSNDQIEEYNVTFSYDYWTSDNEAEA